MSIRSHTGVCGLPSLTLNCLSAFHLKTVQDCEYILIFIILFIITLTAVCLISSKSESASSVPRKGFVLWDNKRNCERLTRNTKPPIPACHANTFQLPFEHIFLCWSMFLCEEKPKLVCSIHEVTVSLQQTWIKLLDSWIVFLCDVFVNFLKLENFDCLHFQKTYSHDDVQNKRLWVYITEVNTRG